MPVRQETAREVLGGKSLVQSAQPFHSGLKKMAAKSGEGRSQFRPSEASGKPLGCDRLPL